MAPEQIETPGDVDQRADIYSLGVVLYEMLTGGLPIGRFALPSEKVSMDARIDHIVMRTLEKEREARYQSAGEVSTEVAALAKHPAPPATKAAASKPETARFATASAVLTALGLLLAGMAACAYFVFENLREWNLERSGQGLVPGAFFILLAISLLVVGVPAILGIILGSKALAEIRLSNGRKLGLGSAIFATTAWPILALFPLASMLMFVPMPGEGGSIGPFMVIIVVLIPVLVAAWLLVRSLYRWAGGVERKDGTRFHPGLGISLLMVMLLTIGGPLLLAVTARLILPAGERRDPEAEMRRTMRVNETRMNDL